MLQKTILTIGIFLIILVALTFGEAFATHVYAWISYLTGLVIHNFADIYNVLRGWAGEHATKILIALVLTVPISLWVIKSKGDDLNKPASQRKIAIVLAIFLGWLGAHRFYQGQIGWGIVFLILFYVVPPVAVVFALIDAVRYLFRSNEEFQQR
ncbi:MAG: TM2 domain-containing protein [Burkholderiaceae bacterium]|nr:TM2 domain-containing protein [Burkholderiaceae bacterium]